MNCLYCYQPLESGQQDYHTGCCKKIFGTVSKPEFPYHESEIEPLAKQIIQKQTTVTGAQPKLSLHLTGNANETKRFTIVGLWGDFILKPPSIHYPFLPEIEDVIMHLANICKIKIVPHSLIRLQSGNLAYITRRIDRIKKEKLHMEDMCQLTERQTEDKYKGSYEQIGKTIKKYSANAGLDIVNFYELVLFSFLTGNADMHLKNFSLIQSDMGMVLSPAYDLVCTSVVNPADTEELGLTLNGKKKKITKKDFSLAFKTAEIDEKQQLNLFNKMLKYKPLWIDFIQKSFLNSLYQQKYIDLIHQRFAALEK